LGGAGRLAVMAAFWARAGEAVEMVAAKASASAILGCFKALLRSP